MLVTKGTSNNKVKNGIDNLAEYSCLLSGKRLGLVTSSAGFDRQIRPTADILKTGFDLRTLFAPEHGINGNQQAGDVVDFSYDEHTGLPVYSLYGKDSHISPEVLSELDAVVFDVQDVGVRYYTYLSLLLSVMEDCGRLGKELIVLDRVNPLGGVSVEGNISRILSQVCAMEIPNRYGLTIGELAKLANTKIKSKLQIVPLSGWRREMLFDDTDLIWINPSPNLPSLSASLVYTGTCLFEGTNISEGRGTSLPFEIVGAPWIDPYTLAEQMNRCSLEGVRFRPVYFTPVCSKHCGKVCGGIQIHVTDFHRFRPLETGMTLLFLIKGKSGGRFEWIHADDIGPRLFIDYLAGVPFPYERTDAGCFLKDFRADAARFEERAEKFYLYQ